MTVQAPYRSIDTSLLFQANGISIKRGTYVSKTKKTVRELRDEALMTAFDLAAKSEVSLSTINRMETGKSPVTRRVTLKVLAALSTKLGRKITIDDIKDLEVK